MPDFVTRHEHDHDGLVSVQSVVLFTEKTTRVTPTLSDALAVIVTVVPRRATEPFAGDVIDTVGAVVSPAGGDCADTVAVPVLELCLASPPNDAVTV